jgi:hypothetical protein
LQEAAQQATYTERVLSEAQRGRMDLQQVNAWLQAELDACRAARRQQEALAAEAQQRAAGLEVRLGGVATAAPWDSTSRTRMCDYFLQLSR